MRARRSRGRAGGTVAHGQLVILRAPQVGDRAELTRANRDSRRLHRGLVRPPLGAADFARYDRLGLHRVEANIQPGNTPSLRLVPRAGFTREGFARRYRKIAGRWRDHERWALLRETWRARSSRRRRRSRR